MNPGAMETDTAGDRATAPGRALMQRLSRLAHVALDMDGTIYAGGTLFPCTQPFLQLLCRLHIGCTFLTNNPSKNIPDYLEHLQRMGLSIGPDQLYTSALATIDHLRRERPDVHRLFVLGTSSMMGEFGAAGFEMTADDSGDEPDAVVVGFDLTLVYSRLCRAAWWIDRGKPFIATNPDRVCPTDQPTLLVDCGAICALLESATGRGPDAVLGKPDPAMLTGILHRHGLAAGQIAMVGDRLYTDVRMARRAGALGVLVLTGEASTSDAAAADPPADLVVSDLEQFGRLLEQSRVCFPK